MEILDLEFDSEVLDLLKELAEKSELSLSELILDLINESILRRINERQQQEQQDIAWISSKTEEIK